MRIGRLIDYPTASGGDDYGRLALELVLDDANRAGGLHGERIELVDEVALGSMERVREGARRLAKAGCVLMLGPAVTDFAVPLMPLLDELQVPAINWSGSARARGAWGFQLKVGSLPDEAGHLVRLIAVRGWRRIAVVRDMGPIGREYFTYLRRSLDALGVTLVGDVEVEPTTTDLRPQAEILREHDPACVVYLGFGPLGVVLCQALRSLAWTVPVAANIGLGVLASPTLEGIIFTDVIDETNPVLAAFAERYARRHGGSPPPIGLGAAHDLAQTALEGIRRAPAPTAAGVRAGLEGIDGLPAACGAPGTVIGFGAWDRDGYKGPLIVLREVRGGRAVSLRL